MRRLRPALVFSLRDPVGSTVARLLVEHLGGEAVGCRGAEVCYELPGGVLMGGYSVDTYMMEHVDESPDPMADVVVVLSRHSSSSGRPSLTTHHTGNPTSRTLGGDPYKLAVAAPPVSKALLSWFREEAEARGLTDKYSITLEATHHGPTRPKKPLVFIEVGSTPEEWRDARALEAMAGAVMRLLEERSVPECTVAAGFGEQHYPSKMTRIHLETDYCLGHIIPRYALPESRDEVFVEAVRRNWPASAEVAFVHKKSVKSALRGRLVGLLEGLGVRVEMI